MATEAQPQVDTKPETQVLAAPNKQLAKLFLEEQQSKDRAQSKLAEACALIKSDRKNFTDEVIKLSLMATPGRGLSKESAATELSRIRNILGDDAKYAALQKGELTVTMARKVERKKDEGGKEIGKGRPTDSPSDKFKKAAAKLAQLVVQQLSSMTKEDFLGVLAEAYDSVKSEHDKTQKELQEAKEKGQVRGDFGVQPQPVEQPAAA